MKAQTNAKNDLTSHLCSGEEGEGGDRRGEEGRGGGECSTHIPPLSTSVAGQGEARDCSYDITADFSAQRIAQRNTPCAPCAPGSFRAASTRVGVDVTRSSNQTAPHRTLRPNSFCFSAQPACLG